jgi:hypothetical protein
MMFDEAPTTTTGRNEALGQAHILPPAVARAEIARVINDFLQGAVSWHAQSADKRSDAPILAAKVTAGTGKSQGALAGLAVFAPAILTHGSIAYYAPTLQLAREAFEMFRELAPHVPAAFVAGRRAVVDGAPLCHRIEELAGLGEMVPSFQNAVCKRLSGDRMVLSDCFASCRYQRQFACSKPRLVFTSHAYLRWQLPIQGDISLRIVDEAYWPTLQSSPLLLVDAWLTGPTRKSVHEQWQFHWDHAHAAGIGAAKRLVATDGPLVYDYGRIARISEARSLVVDAVRNGLSPIAALRAAGIDRETVELFGEWEVRDLPEAAVRPDQDPTTQVTIIRAFDAAERKAALLRAKVWELIAEDFETGETGRLSWKTLTPCRDTGQPRHAIGLHIRHELPLDAPVLMIDADLDPLIVQAYAPSARFVRIDAEQTAEVIQVSDRTMSTTWLLDPEEGRARRDLVRAILAEEIAGNTGPVLLVATKAILQALHRDIDPDGDYSTDDALRRPIAGTQPAWFGPSMRGINRYRDWPRMIVLGRHEPPLQEVETVTRAIFGVVPAGDGEGSRRSTVTADYVMADGSSKVAEISALPYPEGQAVLSQMREVLTNQAIARLRLVEPAGPKNVLILCKIPVPILPVTKLLTWDELACPRVRAAIDAAPEVEGGVRRLQLSPQGLHLDVPSIFPTVGAAKAWRRNRTTDELVCLISRVAAGLGLSVSPINLPGAKGGRCTPAVLLSQNEAVN